jgi:excisionase family DNA binding protein
MNAAFTVRDICDRYGVGEHSVLGWIRSGELRAVNVGRRLGAKKPRWRITQEALDAFEQLRSATPPPPRRTRRPKQPDIGKRYYMT